MYLRRHRKKVDGENYDYWSLVESVRTIRGPRQRIVATIGKLPCLDKEERIGWDSGSHTGLLSGIGHVAYTATVDESFGTWYCTEKTAGRNEGDKIP
jgi:hypothetical protein